MPYFRLVKETDTQIHVSNKGMEVPGAECVHINSDDRRIIIGYYWQHYEIIFEDGRIIKTGIASVNSPESCRAETYEQTFWKTLLWRGEGGG